MIKKNKLIIGVSLFFVFIGAIFILSRDLYEEPTGGMDVSSGISEDREELTYWIETDFIPNAKYSVNIAVLLPVETSDGSLVELLKETTFRADEDMKRFEEAISIEEIKEVILDVDDVNFDNLELTAENWQDYEYMVRMHRTKLWRTYDGLFFFNKLQADE